MSWRVDEIGVGVGWVARESSLNALESIVSGNMVSVMGL